jgi:phospholipase C
MAPPSPIDHVVILVQENHTTDNYFRSMAAFGANVATDWPISPNPPAADQHDRHGYYRWLTKQSTGTHLQFRHDQRPALLRLARGQRRVHREPLLRVWNQLDAEPPAHRRWADPDSA